MTYGLHEQLEVHEIAALKTICLTKSKTMHALVADETLRQLLADDVKISTRQLQELGMLLSKADA
jgi:hypothetical protein